MKLILQNLADWIQNMNWKLLHEYDVIEKLEFMEFEKLLSIDVEGAASKIRRIIEHLITTHFHAHKGKVDSRVNNIGLAVMIKNLDEINVYPRTIKVYLDTLRIIGNIGSHEGGLSEIDLEIIVPMFLHTAKWLITHSLELILSKLQMKKN